jgi:UDP-N-acetylmuramoyl-L-alanyl-D-glutamate--2,6-diaminopimelate ligase
MKLLKDILYGVRLTNIHGNTNIAIETLCLDSRKVKNLSLFAAISGTQTDGHHYIDTAIAAGATAIVCEQLPIELKEGVTYVLVDDSSVALGIIASNFYDNPSEELKVVGVTGTNGKTTTATLLYKLYTQLGFKCGLISTVHNLIAGEISEATHTTPDSITIHRLMADMIDKDCKYCFMEVSSIALHQNRVSGVSFDGAIFTNITHDHLDYHGDFMSYINAKKLFFDGLKQNAFALVNADDKHARVMVQNCKAAIHTYSMHSGSEFKVRIIEKDLNGMLLKVDDFEVWTKLSGVFNAYNFLAVYGAARLLGGEPLNILTTLSTIESVEGRFNTVRSQKGITGIVDYAHTPDALKNIIESIKDVMKPGTKLISVVGCGGNRDTAKRPVMGKIACSLSDKVIFTSDNPRNEQPEQIIEDMKADLSTDDKSRLLSITNREEAIRAAVSLSQPGDVVLVAGKGHEKYQEIAGVKYDFDDRKVLEETFKSLNA